MKQLITIFAITLGLFAFSATAQAQSVQIPGAHANFSKAKFVQLLKSNGLSQQEFNQIGGMHAVVNSLHNVNGKWKFTISNTQKAKLSNFTKGKIQFNGADIGSDELMETTLGSDEFTDIVMGGTQI